MFISSVKLIINLGFKINSINLNYSYCSNDIVKTEVFIVPTYID
jgi:hypothetical protein